MTGTENSSSDATRAGNGEHSGSGHNGAPVTLEGGCLIAAARYPQQRG